MPRKGRKQRHHNTQQAEESDQEQGVLRIGGVVLQLDDEGRVLSRRRERQRQRAGRQSAARQPAPETAEQSASASDAEAVAARDYLENAELESQDAGGRSSGSGSDDSGGLWRRLQLLQQFSGADLEGIGGPVSSGSESSSVESSSEGGFSSDSEDEGSSSSGGDEAASGEGAAGGAAGMLTIEELERLSLAQRYPVQARPQLPPLPGQQQRQQGRAKKKHRPGVKGAKGGKLAPGEKAQLRKERVTAKRAARAASRGFDLACINKELQDLVTRQGDMKAFPPMGKHECQAVQRLAALYGLRSGVQGGSAKRKFVVVTTTERSALPEGEALLQVGRMLAAQAAYELNGLAIIAGPGAAATAAATRGANAGPGSGRGGRWAGLRGTRGGGGSGSAPEFSGPPKKAKKRRPPRPVPFVSGGTIDVDESVEVVMATAAAAGEGPLGPVLGAATELASELGAVEGGANCGLRSSSSASLDAEGEELARAGLGGCPPLLPVAAAAAAAAAAGGEAEPQGPQLEPAGAKAGSSLSGPGLLDVFEDRGGASSGSEEDGEEGEGWPSDAHPGLGSRQAFVYTRVMNASLLGPPRRSPRPAPAPALQGAGPGDGITNASRLLGLGLALGVGPQVFGAPAAGGEEEAGEPDEGAAFLSPRPSRSEQRRQQRRRRNAAAASVPSAPEGRYAGASSSGGRSGRGRRVEQPELASSEEEIEEDAEGSSQDGLGLVSGDYGYFERHTTGIGSRLLAKWGFRGEGAGLGREGSGIAEPVQAERRPKSLGLGAFSG